MWRACGFCGNEMAAPMPGLAAPVDKLLQVTPFPKARATMNETTLTTLAPQGVPVVLHLYTG